MKSGVEIIPGYHHLNHSISHAVVCVGNFDGVHRGHQKIFEITCEKAKSRDGVPVAYTFRPHPQVALRPETNVQLLSTYDEKLKRIAACGIQVIIEEPFSREFSTVSPSQFFNDAILRRLSAEAIVVGYDFKFGKERQGHLQELESLCKKAGVELTVVPAQRFDSEVVSSSKIRQHLLAGEIDAATLLLGRPFSYEGVVIRGEGRGRKLGFPTANLKLENKLALPYGVYATWAVRDGTRYASVTNVGTRPTFQADRELPALVETHLLDVDQDLYGTTLEVQFVRRLRSEKKFPSVDALKSQIARDCQESHAILAH